MEKGNRSKKKRGTWLVSAMIGVFLPVYTITIMLVGGVLFGDLEKEESRHRSSSSDHSSSAAVSSSRSSTDSSSDPTSSFSPSPNLSHSDTTSPSSVAASPDQVIETTISALMDLEANGAVAVSQRYRCQIECYTYGYLSGSTDDGVWYHVYVPVMRADRPGVLDKQLLRASKYDSMMILAHPSAEVVIEKHLDNLFYIVSVEQVSYADRHFG